MFIAECFLQVSGTGNLEVRITDAPLTLSGMVQSQFVAGVKSQDLEPYNDRHWCEELTRTPGAGHSCPRGGGERPRSTVALRACHCDSKRTRLFIMCLFKLNLVLKII